MIRWIPFVFVRIAVVFIGGILLGVYWPDILPEKLIAIVIVFLVLFYGVTYFVQRSRNHQWINMGFIALPVIFLMGYVHVLRKTDARQDNHFIHQDSIDYYQVVITTAPSEKVGSWKLEAKVLEVNTGNWQKYSGNILLYFSKDDFQIPFQYGDVLLIKGRPHLISPASNPGEFDYKGYLSFRKIYHQHFLKKKDVVYVKNYPPGIVMQYSILTRLWADATLKKYVRGDREQAIASALVLGVTDGLDNELLAAYAATGAMHVLAVSGLHVSIIYLIIAFVFKPMAKWKFGKWALAFLSIVLLWSYAFVTGLSPSVLRAVTMFSFIAIARPLNHHTNIYNTLGASAFFLLVYEPYLIMSVGFQLSYLAVVGIVYLQPLFLKQWEPRSQWAQKVWEISCVSIAAQVATFSLGLLYFHQFPNYFLFSNLFVIPGSFGVLVLGLALLSFSFLQSLAGILGFALEWLIKMLNFIVFMVESFPFSLIENIHISTLQCWLLMGFVVALILLFQFRKFQYLIGTSIFIFLFCLMQWNHFSEEVAVQKITCYKVPGHSAMDLIDAGRVYFFADDQLKADEEKVRFHILPNRLNSGVQLIQVGEDHSITQKFQGCRLIHWQGRSILQLEERNFKVPDNLKVDFLVVGHNSVHDIAVVADKIQAKQFILDSSNSIYYADRVLRQASDLGMNIFSVHHEGAFEFKLETQSL